MNLLTITEDRQKAKVAFREYRAAVRERHNDEDTQIMRGYRELARGHQLIRLTETINRGGFNGFRPRLAIARADWPKVWLQRRWSWTTPNVLVEVIYQAAPSVPLRATTRRIPVLIDNGPSGPGRTSDPSAIVPIIPPGLRPKHALSNYHILFEAIWSQEPPKDPALLRYIGGDLWAILTTWDLTEVERAVLAGRSRG